MKLLKKKKFIENWDKIITIFTKKTFNNNFILIIFLIINQIISWFGLV